MQKLGAVRDVKGHTAIGTEVSPGDGYDFRICINRVQGRCGVHPGQQPCRAVAGSSAEFKESSAWLRRSESCQEGAHFRLRHHVEAQRLGFNQDVRDRCRPPRDFRIIHR